MSDDPATGVDGADGSAADSGGEDRADDGGDGAGGGEDRVNDGANGADHGADGRTADGGDGSTADGGGEGGSTADGGDGADDAERTDAPTPDEATFDAIMEKFAGSPSQQAVIRLLLERGFSVNDEGRVVSGGIEIPNTGIAREVGVDRRVVDATTDAILADDQLRRIFQNIAAIPSLMDLAPVLDLTALAITVRDAEEPGLVAAVTGAIADRGVSIRQTISEDPEFTDEPRLYVITDGELPGDLINEIRALEFVHKIELR